MRSGEYLNFDLAIEVEDDGYLATVRASPVGEARETFQLPFTPDGIELLILKLGQSRTTVRRGTSSPQVPPAREFGTTLYESVFDGEVEFAYRRSLEEAERQGMGLRLRLNLDRAPDLVDLPWELLYSPTLHGPLVLFEDTPLVRYIELPFPPRPLEVEGPLQILVVVAGPTDLVELDADEEMARIEEATRDLQNAGFVQVDYLTGATLADLVRHLRTASYHVLHFVGHGGYDDRGGVGDGVLAFEDAEGRNHLVSGHDLGVLLRGHKTLRLAVLNSCEGARASPADPFAGVAQSLVRQGIPAVVAMQFEITDTAAKLFGHELYRALIDGCPVDEATGIARQAVFAVDSNSVEWATPVLYLRSTSGHIFDVPAVDTTGLIPVVHADPVEQSDPELDDWYREATTAWDQWRAAPAGPREDHDDLEAIVATFERIVERDADYRDAATHLADARGQLAEARGQLAGNLYRAASVRLEAGDWAAVIDELDRVDALDQDHGDPDGLRDRARRGAEEERQRRAAPPAPPAPPAPRTPAVPTPREPVPRRRLGLASVAGVGLLVVAALGWFVLADDPPPPVETDLAATWLDAPAVATGDGSWAADLVRYPTRHPAEGEARPRVSSDWSLGWNDDALYLWVEVTDPQISTPYAAEPWLLYRGDGINLLFGEDPTTLDENEPLRDDDIQVTVGPADPGAARAVAGTQVVVGDGGACPDGRAFADGRRAPGITTASARTPNGYRLAAAVPWTVLDHQPRAGEVYGVILSVADVQADADGTPRQRGSRSTATDRAAAKHCPAQWQTLTLLAP